jgi:hypothetical protein
MSRKLRQANGAVAHTISGELRDNEALLKPRNFSWNLGPAAIYAKLFYADTIYAN